MLDIIVEFWPIVALISIGLLVVLITWMSRYPARGLYLAFFTSGILITPNLPIVREKFTLTEFVFLFTWVALLVRQSFKKKEHYKPLTSEQKTSLILGVAFTAWVLLSFSLNNMEYTRGFIPSLVETLNFVYGYMMFLTTVFLVRDWKSWKGCLDWWIAGAVVVVFFGVWATLGHAPSWTFNDYTHRVSSTLRNENQLPSFLLPIFTAMVFIAVRRNDYQYKKIGMWILVAGSMIAAIGSGSRTALLMLIVAYLGVIYVAIRTKKGRVYNLSALTNISLSLFAGFIVYFSIAILNYDGHYSLGHTPAWQRPVVMLYDWLEGERALDTTRPKQLEVVSEHFTDNIIFGTGPKMYGGLYEVSEIHNTYAGILLQTGVIGFILFMTWLISIIWYAFKASSHIREPYQKLMVLCLIVGMVTLLLYSMTIYGLRQRNIWLLAGLLVASLSLVEQRTKMVRIHERRNIAAIRRPAPSASFSMNRHHQ